MHCVISIHALLAESDPPRGDSCYLDNIISIHALLAESDMIHPRSCNAKSNFYPRSPCGERPRIMTTTTCIVSFLSTLSLRRATVAPLLATGGSRYFYPRSPCGERPTVHQWDGQSGCISIHALLAESDGIGLVFLWWGVRFLSTLSLRRATDRRPVLSGHDANFYPRSPCGERPGSTNQWKPIQAFLSTLSLRRATYLVRGQHPN